MSVLSPPDQSPVELDKAPAWWKWLQRRLYPFKEDLSEITLTVNDIALAARRGSEPNTLLRLIAHMRSMARWQNIWVLWSFLLCALVWWTYWEVRNRPVGYARLKPTLRESQREFFDQNDYNRDDIDAFLFKTLTILESFSFQQGNMRGLLLGLVNQDIIKERNAEFSKRLLDIQKEEGVQTLVVLNIDNFTLRDVPNRRIAMLVRGFMQVSQYADSGLANIPPVPYRARVLLEIVPKSAANHDGFYIQTLDARLGDEALQLEDEWKKLQESTRANLNSSDISK